MKAYLENGEWADEWQKFVDGELRRSNDTNNRNLGGQQPRNSMDEDDQEKDYEMNMEKIMAKFSNFNSQMSNRSSASSNDNDDEDEEDVEIARHEDDDDDDEDRKGDGETRHESPTKQRNPQSFHDDDGESSIALKPIESEFKEPEPLVTEFAANEFWAPLNPLSAVDLDELLADYE